MQQVSYVNTRVLNLMKSIVSSSGSVVQWYHLSPAMSRGCVRTPHPTILISKSSHSPPTCRQVTCISHVAKWISPLLCLVRASLTGPERTTLHRLYPQLGSKFDHLRLFNLSPAYSRPQKGLASFVYVGLDGPNALKPPRVATRVPSCSGNGYQRRGQSNQEQDDNDRIGETPGQGGAMVQANYDFHPSPSRGTKHHYLG
ncbi:hypothetical protein VNO77_08212 [Canavalia gladiata]|uniref:Uncharacterized protein n=1 Tax=Canavalia gladiata TaxID=3824 RepID=A0AAN9M957_CANGL